MNFSYNWLQSFFKSNLPKPEKLADLLTMHSFEVEGIEKRGKDFLLDIDVLPNRSSDCLSHLGIAREISALLGKKMKVLKDNNRDKKDSSLLKVQVESEKDCPRYTAKIIESVKVGSSPKWVKERIESCGIQSINNIVDIANYVMLEIGQPLHAFDYDKVSGGIFVRRAKKEEEIVSLDDNKYKLDSEVLVISDKESPLAIAGIKGGKKAEIEKDTKTIILESANFQYSLIRKTSRELSLKTDASWRFENEIDPNLTEKAINRAAYLIQKEAGGKDISGNIDYYPNKRKPKTIELNNKYLRNLLGVDIKDKEIKDILERLGFEVLKNKVKIPTFRLDLSIEEDLIEEVGRVYGFENIPSQFPLTSLSPPEKNFPVFWENFVKDVLKENFSEVYNYSFISKEQAEDFGYKKGLAEIKNPLSLDQKYLRPSLIPNLLKVIKENSNNFDKINIFELGKVFWKNKEERILSVFSDNDDFYRLKGVVDNLLEKMGISEIWYDDFKQTPEESKKNFWEKGRSAEIKVDSEEIGFLGEISSSILEKMKIERKVTAFEINFEKLQKIASEEQEYQPISRYPSAVRDIAVLVPRETKVEEIMNLINSTVGSLIRDIDLFDIYEGEGMPEGKKNLAFHIIYQSEERTLDNKEINELQDKIVKTLDSEVGWQVRK